MRRASVSLALVLSSLAGCEGDSNHAADLLLLNGRVYTLTWTEPDSNGRPAQEAPRDARGWRPDAEAVAIRDGRIVFVGARTEAERWRGPKTDVRDLAGATVLPGLIDSHVHLDNHGASLERVNLVGVATEAEAVDRVVRRAANVPKGEWIDGWGWDEGAWTGRYPDGRLLSERAPDHPVVLRGLHSFAVWGNQLALDRAGITATTHAPEGGEIVKDAQGRPTGVLLNNAAALLTGAIPLPPPARLQARVSASLNALAAAGYVSVHEAGADTALMSALEALAAKDQLPLRVYAMIAARDTALTGSWVAGPRRHPGASLVVGGVKAFYDGAMGSRGAFFFQPYSDKPGHVGVGGAGYGFDAARMTAMMKAGFQVTIHAIGDRANREALDFFERVMAESPATRGSRPRIEHVQVVSKPDVARFKTLGVIASMQPSHAVEDMPWAEARIGRERIKGAYAWRTLRRAGATLVFNSDLPGTDYNFLYGLHSAVTRQDKDHQPAGGWRPDERMTIEEAIRGWTTWAAFAGFEEHEAGVLAAGRRGDVTVVDIDPFQVGETEPAKLLSGRIVLTIIGGRVVK